MTLQSRARVIEEEKVMNDHDLRLRALELATATIQKPRPDGSGTVAMAERYLRFLSGRSVSAAPSKSTAKPRRSGSKPALSAFHSHR